MNSESLPHKALLVLPRLRVQNANAISSPLTWGFPAMSAFLGLTTALERRLPVESGIALLGVSVICHHFEPQVTQGGYTRSFHLTRNPVLQDGSSAGIVEEGRVHLDITLVFDVQIAPAITAETERTRTAMLIADLLAGMRIAGGSIIPQHPGSRIKPPRPYMVLVSDDHASQERELSKLARRLLPGFVLVSRHDLLMERLAEFQAVRPEATLLDAWLDLSRLNYRAKMPEKNEGQDLRPEVDHVETVEWKSDARPGWLVPIPVGFAALSELYAPGSVAGARDRTVPFRFVESVYSIGQWISPLRLKTFNDLFWYPEYEEGSSSYRCTNGFQAPKSSNSPQQHNN